MGARFDRRVRAIDLVGVPFNSSGTTDGVARAPAVLREAGLVAELLATTLALGPRNDGTGQAAGVHHVDQSDRMVVRHRSWRSQAMETLVGIALVVIAAIEVGWIVRTVQANMPRA
jgi:arginase family enzyme